jgi:hypothetical protein
VITLGQNESDNNKRMITLTEENLDCDYGKIDDDKPKLMRMTILLHNLLVNLIKNLIKFENSIIF